jgi:hypothetical protein
MSKCPRFIPNSTTICKEAKLLKAVDEINEQMKKKYGVRE